MTEVLLLQGPDGNRYKATNVSTNVWEVVPFLCFNYNLLSDWWKSQCGNQWFLHTTYKTSQIKQIYSILAKKETFYEPPDIVIHYD